MTTKQFSLRFFVILLGVLGVTCICVIYSLHLNYPPIRSDGLGYYLYLPATVIYHDISLLSIADLFNNGHIPEATPAAWKYSGPSMWENSTNYLIKYPMGTAILMLPFFLLACFGTLMTGTPVNGFSPIFQYTAAIAGFVYAVAGIIALWKILERQFRLDTIFLAMLGMVFGTNLFHYATYDSVFSHVYSFFLFSAFLYIVQLIYSECYVRYFLISGVLCGLIIITRPTNGLWVVFGLLYGVNSLQTLLDRLLFLKNNAIKMMYGVFLCSCVILMQLTYWKTITGNWVIFSYRGEFFDFAKPEILNVLFSVRKGLFFWSPILLTVIPGLYFLGKKAHQFFIPILLFLPINIYVISSWHCWFYGGSFGHRAFVESIPLFAICFCAFYEGLESSFWKQVVSRLTVCCVLLETWLMLKYWTGSIPFDGTTWEYLATSFFVL